MFPFLGRMIPLPVLQRFSCDGDMENPWQPSYGFSSVRCQALVLPCFLHHLKNYILVEMCNATDAKLKICFKISVQLLCSLQNAASFSELAIAVWSQEKLHLSLGDTNSIPTLTPKGPCYTGPAFKQQLLTKTLFSLDHMTTVQA